MARQSRYSDEDILRAIRAAAAQGGEPLSHARYDELSERPSSARIIQRFGTWSKACAAAGVATTAAQREYAQRWDADSVSAAVAEYLRSEGSAGTYAGYAAWAKGDADRPSGATVRNVFGGWSAAKQAAGD